MSSFQDRRGRTPLLIHGSGKKVASVPKLPPIPARRQRLWTRQAVVLSALLLCLVGALLAAFPESTAGAQGGFSPLAPVMSLFHSNGESPNAIAQQAATVTAVTRDGYDRGPVHYTGLPNQPRAQAGTLDRFAYGQCTYWADYRYHELTGYWVPWIGNADQWAAGAAASGWVVSDTPHVPSIIVLQPNVQGAGSYGHVAVVERINDNGTVYTSNYNWYSNGGWNTLSYVAFSYPAAGVSFVWHP